MNVAIIGAGVSGLYLGLKLSQKGHKVTIFEKNSQIGRKTCSGLFSYRIFDYVPEARDLIEHEINSIIVRFPKKAIRVFFSKKFVIINHSKLDILLADLARAAGAEILLNREITELPQGFDRIIGSDGADSFVRNHLRMKAPAFRLGIQGFCHEKGEGLIQAIPCENGFIWRIPRKDNVEYGIIANANQAHTIFATFIKKNDIRIKDVRAKIIPQGFCIPKKKRITLCGDAAGLTKPWSGGGVIWGLKAADILLKKFPDFKKYRREAELFFKPKIIISKLAIKLAMFLADKAPWLLPAEVNIESDYLF
ncbi:NAD(P)-binding protein [Patescibacteria group bacterium]|nr:NAD(P)-binding protein [Patescibacteria group bacterium]